ncbi:hypothetical protein POM88_041623 [Heracleum sosnowskyi]|uniref:Uncharacterized protein n=1 Tax=Heracleum sosnowskyi TaxID=360622 RepID=A0AAD8MAW6_9APIA|nr:hypothetical protein POM88_041623 [Heracleum sosnowskyi]
MYVRVCWNGYAVRMFLVLLGDDGEVDFKEDAKFAQHLKEALQISYRKNGIPAFLSCLNREDRWHSIVYILLQLWNDIEDTFDVTPENQKAIIQSAANLMRFILGPNLLGLPAISVPVGYDKQGLPIELCANPKKKPQSFYDVLKGK